MLTATQLTGDALQHAILRALCLSKKGLSTQKLKQLHFPNQDWRPFLKALADLDAEELVHISYEGRTQIWWLTPKGLDLISQHTAASDTEVADDLSATICVREGDLDEWWQSLDVEQKADAFTEFSLTMRIRDVLPVHVRRFESIPVIGTIGSENPKVTPEEQAAQQ